MTHLFEIRSLSFGYQLGSCKVAALQDVNLTVDPGELTCLVGPSGSGKTTLLNVLGLIEPTHSGSVRFLAKDLAHMAETDLNDLRRFQLGFIFQQFHLLPVLNAMENVEYFLLRQRIPSTERARRVRAALEAVGLWEQRLQRPFEMSGGQRQRVAVARAIAKRPRIIIADEPTASLDQDNGRHVMETLSGLRREFGVTVVIASHDSMVHGMVERLIHLRDGRIVHDTATGSQATT